MALTKWKVLETNNKQKKGNLPYKKSLVMNEVIKRIVGGEQRRHIVAYLQEQNFTSEKASEFYYTAKEIIFRRVETDLEKNSQAHLFLYEEIFKFFNQTRNVRGKLKALKQKEDLLGLHKTEDQIEINNTTNVQIATSIFDKNKLTQSENGRLDELLSKISQKPTVTLQEYAEKKYLK